jgi:hypothetical protein
MKNNTELQREINIITYEQTLIAFKANEEPCEASITLVEDLIKSLKNK